MDTPAKARVGERGGVFVISCKYVLGQPQLLYMVTVASKVPLYILRILPGSTGWARVWTDQSTGTTLTAGLIVL